jgi:hypothetical protein
MECLPCIFHKIENNDIQQMPFRGAETCRSVCIYNKHTEVHLLDIIILNLQLNKCKHFVFPLSDNFHGTGTLDFHILAQYKLIVEQHQQTRFVVRL